MFGTRSLDPCKEQVLRFCGLVGQVSEDLSLGYSPVRKAPKILRRDQLTSWLLATFVAVLLLEDLLTHLVVRFLCQMRSICNDG